MRAVKVTPVAGESDMATGELVVIEQTGAGRIVVTDSLTFCDARVGTADVVIGGSFAGAVAFGFVLARGPRAIIAHAAGVGKDAAGISGLAAADEFAVPAAAVETMSARLGDGGSVFREGVLGHVNRVALTLGVRVGMTTRETARLLLQAPHGRVVPSQVNRSRRVVAETPRGRIVLMVSVSFADASNRHDVLCAGSHGGRVNALALSAIVRPRGVIMNDGGMAKDRSGVSGLDVLDESGVAAGAVDALTARIGDPASTYETGIISALNHRAQKIGVCLGQPARDAALQMLSQ